MADRLVYFDGGIQYPGVPFGRPVSGVPVEVDKLYNEARLCTAAGAHTAAVLVCRKLLMHIAVAQGAAPGLQFVAYVEHLAANGFVPPNGKGWVDHIRTVSNEANHEIVLMSAVESQRLVTFIEMLLKFIYEFPAQILKSS